MEHRIEITVRLDSTETPATPNDTSLQDTMAYIQTSRTLFELRQRQFQNGKEGESRCTKK